MRRRLIILTVALGVAWFATIMLAIWTADPKWAATAIFGWMPAFVAGMVASVAEDRA